MQKEQVVQLLGNPSSTLAHALTFPTHRQVPMASCQIPVLETRSFT